MIVVYPRSLTELTGLVAKKNLEKLKNVLKYEGAFAVSELPPEYTAAFRSFDTCMQKKKQCKKGLSVQR
jgi:hypothetical protein